MWLAFVGIVVSLLAFDLGVLHQDDHEIGVRESLLLSAGYISAALLFGAWVWWYLGAQSGTAYYTGFMIEKSLSMDNVFVIALIFSFFAIPRQYQHRVLFWGILGVIVLRAIMIGLGATLVSQFSWGAGVFDGLPDPQAKRNRAGALVCSLREAAQRTPVSPFRSTAAPAPRSGCRARLARPRSLARPAA